MSNGHTNGTYPAFPTPKETNGNGDVIAYANPGLTKREYIATKCMQAIITGDLGADDRMAKDAVRMADSLLCALSDEEQR